MLSQMYAGSLGVPQGKLWCWVWQMKPQNTFRSLSTDKILKVRRRQNQNAQPGDLCSNQHIGIHHNKAQEWEAVGGFRIKEDEVVVGVVVIRGDLEALVAQTLHQGVWVDQEGGRGLICTMEEAL